MVTGFSVDKTDTDFKNFECCTFDHSDNSPFLDSGYSISVLQSDFNPVFKKKRGNVFPPFSFLSRHFVRKCSALHRFHTNSRRGQEHRQQWQQPPMSMPKLFQTYAYRSSSFSNNLLFEIHQMIPVKTPVLHYEQDINSQNVL